MIQEIEIGKLKIHPKNVRKSYNDIDELAASIRSQGILQNLTVVPDPDDEGMYLVVIGNRRLTAARMAGIKTAPCYIANLTEKEQASMMLLENMQRDDLTIYEQAQGFQMVLDLGETEDALAEKTGFSKTTIRRRLNIAKLDQEELQKKEQDGGFQLSLKDLYELEKVSDVKKRNEILKNAKDSKDISWRVQSLVLEKKREANSKKLIKMMQKKGIEEAPEGTASQMYSNKWETLKSYSLESELPKSIDVEPEGKEKIYYYKSYREIKIIRKAKKVEHKLTPEEIKKKEKDKRKKQIKEIAKEMSASRRDFILSIISGKVESLKDTKKVEELCWQVMLSGMAYISKDSFATFILGKNSYEAEAEEKEKALETISGLSTINKTLITTYNSTKESELMDWKGYYAPEAGKRLDMFCQALSMYGFTYNSDEERQVADGTHELYEKDEENE